MSGFLNLLRTDPLLTECISNLIAKSMHLCVLAQKLGSLLVCGVALSPTFFQLFLFLGCAIISIVIVSRSE